MYNSNTGMEMDFVLEGTGCYFMPFAVVNFFLAVIG